MQLFLHLGVGGSMQFSKKSPGTVVRNGFGVGHRGGSRLLVSHCGRSLLLEVFHYGDPAWSSLDPSGDDPKRSVRQPPLQLHSPVRRRGHPGLGLVGVLRITGIALGWTAPTSAFGSVVRKAKMSLVVSPALIFRTDVQFVQTPAKQASGRVSSSADQSRRL
jgi:hypothetical protein